jgi:hypothetical protein
MTAPDMNRHDSTAIIVFNRIIDSLDLLDSEIAVVAKEVLSAGIGVRGV